ncbi:hypothetical protein YC2023_104278 [Brassica napus]
MASLGLWKKVATPLPSGWKMACTTVAAPFSSTVENSDPIKAEKVGKMKVFQKLKSLGGWIKRRWCFLPPNLSLDLLGELKGAEAASAYFDKVEPKFDEMDADAENRPAYLKVLHWFRVKEQNQTSGAKPHMEDQGFCITKADLNRWIKLLEKQGQTQKALQVLSLSTRLRTGNTFPFIINCVERLTIALFLGSQVTISPDVTQVATTGFLHGYANST